MKGGGGYGAGDLRRLRRLGAWIAAQRNSYLHPGGSGGLSAERVRRLEAIGVTFDADRESERESAAL